MTDTTPTLYVPQQKTYTDILRILQSQWEDDVDRGVFTFGDVDKAIARATANANRYADSGF